MQNQIKFYYGNAIDRGGRIALGDLMPKCNSVFVYAKFPNPNVLYVEPAPAESKIEQELAKCRRSVDDKMRVAIPKELRGKATRALIGKDGSKFGVVLWLQYE